MKLSKIDKLDLRESAWILWPARRATRELSRLQRRVNNFRTETATLSKAEIAQQRRALLSEAGALDRHISEPTRRALFGLQAAPQASVRTVEKAADIAFKAGSSTGFSRLGNVDAEKFQRAAKITKNVTDSAAVRVGEMGAVAVRMAHLNGALS